MHPRPLLCCVLVALTPANPITAAPAAPPDVFDFAKLPLVDRIDCAAEPVPGEFRQFPEDASKVETILGRSCRTLANDSDQMKYFAYNIGKGKGLKAGAAYVLVVDYPEDQPRTMFILNRGNETGRGISTGSSVADALFGLYVNNNSESVQYPLSGTWQQWQSLFYLHDRFPEFAALRGDPPRPVTPEQGFWVVIAQANQNDAAGSAGAAVAAICLYEVPDPAAYNVKINYPPDNLPKRYLFCREEMADGVVSVPHGKDKPMNRGLNDPVDWYEYKARNMRFLGMNTFTKDLLEFGHNQGWDAEDDNWFVRSSTPGMWANILGMLKNYPELYVLPYYEYGGGTGAAGLGKQRNPLKLNGDKEYTHLDWINKNAHIDILDPAALEDAKKLLDLTILKFKSEVKFVGAWFRPRPVQMPISFADESLAIYTAETGAKATREDLAADKAALQVYYKWWFKKRQAFIEAMAGYLRENGIAEAVVLLTFDSSEPGAPLPGNVLVTDDPDEWKNRMTKLPKKKEILPLATAVATNAHRNAMGEPHGTWGKYEWQHAVPGADPENYTDSDRTVLTYSFNRLYTVSSEKTFAGFRSGAGLAAIRHHSLNENIMDDKIGYFACDVEPAGPYSMLADARAVAYGDPRFLGYLISNTLARGYPQYAREFNQAFLALPAIPSEIQEGGASDAEVIVRRYDAGEAGLYLAVVNTSLQPKMGVKVRLPKQGALTNAATGETLKAVEDHLVLDLYPGQLCALLLK